MLSNPYPVGQRVRHSVYAMQSSRDAWQREGQPARKERYKQAYYDKLAERGTVVEVLDNGYRVKWDNGSESQCLSGRVDKEDSPLFK